MNHEPPMACINDAPPDIVTDRMRTNATDIRRTLAWLHRDGDTFEIRTMDSQLKPWAKTNSGYFDSIETATDAVTAHYEEYQPAATYVTLNPTHPDIRSRAYNRIELRAKNTTRDSEIIAIRNLLIDADPNRPKGVPATAEERALARTKVESVRNFLDGHGFPTPLTGMSNNGWHLVYALDLHDDCASASKLVKRLLQILHWKFGDEPVKIDTSVHNPARLTKVYGLLHYCGDDVVPRSNQLSYIAECPTRKPIGDALGQLVDDLSADYESSLATKRSPKTPRKPRSVASQGKFNVQHVLDRCGIGYSTDGHKFVLNHCVFNGDHNHGEVAVFENDDGSTAYHCFHDSCQQYHWREFVTKIGNLRPEDFYTPGVERDAGAPGESELKPDTNPFDDDEPEENAHETAPFPLERLPTVVHDIVKEVSTKCNSHPAIVATTALSVLAACTQNVAVTRTEGWHGEVNLAFWAIIIADSAAGKSRGMKPILRPLKEIEDAKNQEAARQRRLNQTVIKELRSHAAKTKAIDGFDLLKILQDTPESEEIMQRRQLDDQIDKLENPRPTSCLFGDTTPEAMLARMRYSNERAAVIQEEAGFLDLVTGDTYGRGEATTNMINMWDGSSIDSLRKGSGQIFLQHPSLTICVGMTPERFVKYLRKKPVFSEGGFAQRFVVVKPITKAEPKQSVGINASIRENWDGLVKELVTMDVPENDQETPQPKILSISPDGEALLLKLSHSIAAMINRNRDDWGPLWKAWMKRFEAFTIRIATYFHAARHGIAYIDHAICAQDIKDAGAVTTYFKDQADHVLNDRTENEQERNERLVKAFLDKQEAGKRLTIRDIDRNMTRRIKSDAKVKRSTKIAMAIDALINDGYSLERISENGKRAIFMKR